MRGGRFTALLAGFVLSSCGLETVPAISPPDVDIFSSSVTETKLSFVHEDSRYDGADYQFQGYIVYYKIYPLSTTQDLSRLTTDRDSLSTSPTEDRLLSSMGYHVFFVSENSAGDSKQDIILDPADGSTVTMDFTAFLDPSSPSGTVPTVSGSKPYLFRASDPLIADRSFAALRTITKIEPDMSSAITTAQLGAKEFEITVFISASAITSTLTAVKSPPVPWGIIRTVKPF